MKLPLDLVIFMATIARQNLKTFLYNLTIEYNLNKEKKKA